MARKKSRAMSSKSKNIARIIIGILFIVWSIGSVALVIDAILAFNIPAIIGAASSICMLIAGVLGLTKTNRKLCLVFVIIVILTAAAQVLTSLMGGYFAINPIITLILALLFAYSL